MTRTEAVDDQVALMVLEAVERGVRPPCADLSWAALALARSADDRRIAAAACRSCSLLDRCSELTAAAPPSAGVAAGRDFGPCGRVGPRVSL